MSTMNPLQFLFLLHAFAVSMAFTITDKNTATEDNIQPLLDATPEQKVEETLQITVDTSSSLQVLSPYYLSLTIDSGQIRYNMRGFDFSSKKLQNLASALSPTNIRWGGTNADFLHFDPNGLERPVSKQLTQNSQEHHSDHHADPIRSNFTMTGEMWMNITRFCDKVGWDIMFDFNLFFWRNGLWDPSNADLLLKYSAERGIRIPSFQLGNEPDAYERGFGIKVDPDVLVKDFKILRNLISKYPQYDASSLYGPDITNMASSGSQKDYMWGFLTSGGCDAVTEITFHHYYMNGKTAKLEDFVNPHVLDNLKGRLDVANKLSYEACGFYKPLCFTETSSTYGGGTPNISDAYAAGFMWLDKLGVSATHNLTHVYRQEFYGGSYPLIDGDLNPNPDYYLSVLYKRLVDGPVFDVTVSDDTPYFRVYAHCARTDYYGYPDGAMVLYFMNLEDDPVRFSVPQYQNDLFLLTPGDSAGLLSRFVKLNGDTLIMNGDELPEMLPKHNKGDITVPGLSLGFMVSPSANVKLCNLYHSKKV